MSKLTKNQKLVADKIEAGKAYTLKEASALVKEITTTKFDASVDIDMRLGVDPRKANQMVRGVVSLPNGTGKVTRVLCLCTPDAEAAAKEAGAEFIPYNYTTPLVIFACFGIAAFFLALYLKVIDKKNGYGLEEANIKN